MVVMSLHQLANYMDDLSRETWVKIVRAHRVKMSMGEVAISQHNLLLLEEQNIALARPIRIVEVTQNEEKRFGADFEIWLQLRDKRAFGYSIQAKRVKIGKRHHSYPELSHVGVAGDFQYDTLINHARTVRSVPMHLFYNGWDHSSRKAPYSDAVEPELYGCAAVGSTDVKAIRENGSRKNNKVAAYAASSMPWSALLRPQNQPTQVGPADPSSTDAEHVPDTQFELDVKALAERMRPYADDRPNMLADTLPDYVSEARSTTSEHLPSNPKLPRFALVIEAE